MTARMYGRIGTVWVGCGLIANYVWEMLQMPLYGEFRGGWWRCFEAALGDVAILAVLYLVMALAAEDWCWFMRLSRWRLLLLAVLGILIAVLVEQQALLGGAWSYRGSMPRVPLLGVGWPPILQMVLIPGGLAALCRSWCRGHLRGRGDLHA